MSTPVPAPFDKAEVVKRTLHFFWIADYSGSMKGTRIATLNQAIREVLHPIRTAVASRPVEVFMRAIKFSDEAQWHVGPAPVALEQFVWPELTAHAGTSTAKAIRLLAGELTLEKMPRRGVPPVCILLSDGHHTDPQEEYDGAIQDLLKLPWGSHAVRLAIAIGEDESAYDEQSLLKFISHKEVGVLKAHTAQELVNFIKWASTEAVKASSEGKDGKAGGNAHVQMPAPPSNDPAATAETEGF